MNQQSPQQQQPVSQPQGSQPIPSPPQSQPKKPRHTTKGFWRRLSGDNKVAILIAIIGAIGVVLAATIPVVTQLVRPSPNPNGLTPPVTITSSPPPNVYPPLGWKVTFSDPLKSNSSGYWIEGKRKEGECAFANDTFRVSRETPDGNLYCWPVNHDFSNFAFEVQMIIAKGDQGVVLFRADTQSGNFYSFWISPDGTYGFEIWQNNYRSKSLVSSSHTAIHIGFNQPNTVAVVAQGNTFHLYVNDQLIDMVIDQGSSYGHGNICLAADSNSNLTEVLFSNVKVWEPSS